MNHDSNPALYRLLGSNVAPNAREAASLQLQFDDIASQISLLRSRLAELEDQLQLHRIVLSPVRRIPAAVLGEIFVHLLPDLLEPGARDNLVEIQLVCKGWRDAARLTQKLWSALSFEDLTDVPYKKVKQWFDRAGNTPKSLAYSTAYHELCPGWQSFTCGSLRCSSLATLFVSLEGTLDHLSLSYRDPTCLQTLLNSLGRAEEGSLSLQRRSWHALKSFTLEFQEWIESPDPLRSMFLQLPPNITSFELRLPSKYSHAFRRQSDSTIAPLPLPQNLLERLSSLTLCCDWDGKQWLEPTLVHCTNVETLTVDFMGSWSNHGTELLPSSGLLLPKVRTLRLNDVSPYTIDIIRVLKAPRLVELDLGLTEEDCEWKLSEHVLSLIERSRCDTTLRLFHLRYAHVKSEELLATLRGLPFLTHLTLQSVPAETIFDVFEVFAIEECLQPNLPNLETLELLQLRPDVYPHSLISFLQSRRPYGMQNGKPVFMNPQDTFKRLTVTYQTTFKEREYRLADFESVEILRKWGGVSVNIGPKLCQLDSR